MRNSVQMAIVFLKLAFSATNAVSTGLE